jgi:hypothetical protein
VAALCRDVRWQRQVRRFEALALFQKMGLPLQAQMAISSKLMKASLSTRSHA